MLIQRNNRGMALTDEGRYYLGRCEPLLAEIDALEQQLRGDQQEPCGRLSVGAPASLANHLLIPVLPGFFERHPAVSIDLDQSQHAYSPVPGAGHRSSDVLLRVGPFEDSSLVARPLGRSRLLTVASPAYIAAAGLPKHPNDLAQHRCIAISIPDTGRSPPWPFERNGRRLEIEVTGPLITNGGDGRVQAALRALGITQAPAFQVQRAIADGQLLRLLPEWESLAPAVYVLYGKTPQPVPRVVAFVAYLLECYPAA